MTKAIGAFARSMARSSQSAHRQKKNTFRFVITDFMPSIKVMAVWDAEMRCTNLVAKWHGSISPWLSHLQRERTADSHEKETAARMVAWGQRYALHSYLTIPLNPDEVSSAVEENYQRSQTKTRNMIERSFAFGVLISLGDDAVLPMSLFAT